VRDRRVKVKKRSSVPGGEDRIYDIRISDVHFIVRETGRRDGAVQIPWERIMATAFLYLPEAAPIDLGDSPRVLSMVLNSLDRCLGKMPCSAVITPTGIGVRRDQDPPGWRKLGWHSIINLSVRQKW
jgi:hypothetical protein